MRIARAARSASLTAAAALVLGAPFAAAAQAAPLTGTTGSVQPSHTSAIASAAASPTAVPSAASSSASSGAAVAAAPDEPFSVTVGAPTVAAGDSTLLLDPTKRLTVSAVGCTGQHAALRWVLFPDETSQATGDGTTTALRNGAWAQSIDLPALVHRSGEAHPTAEGWTLGITCLRSATTSSTLLIPAVLSKSLAAAATTGTQLAPGRAVVVTGRGLEPGESVLVDLVAVKGHGTVELGTTTATATGTVRSTLVVPSFAKAGSYRLVVRGVQSGHSSSRAVTVVSGASRSTGASKAAGATAAGAYAAHLRARRAPGPAPTTAAPAADDRAVAVDPAPSRADSGSSLPIGLRRLAQTGSAVLVVGGLAAVMVLIGSRLRARGSRPTARG